MFSKFLVEFTCEAMWWSWAFVCWKILMTVSISMLVMGLLRFSISSQEEKSVTEDEMIGWHHRLNGYEFEQALGVDDGQMDREAWRAAVHGVTKSWT